MGELFELQNLIGLVALTALEIVLGVDNVVFIAILVAKLPPFQQRAGWRTALTIAMISRIVLLLAICWGFMELEKNAIITIKNHPVTGRDLILILGGLFLIAKATYEIHDKLEGDPETGFGRPSSSFRSVMLQVIPLNLVFSLDSVITAVGMTSQIKPLWVQITVMIASIVISSGVMVAFAGAIGGFVDRHPTVKMLGLAFLVLIGVMLVAEGFHQKIPKGYIYFAMAFSLFVEILNIRMRKASQPVRLHQTYVAEPAVQV